jgi:hypothetical protein
MLPAIPIVLGGAAAYAAFKKWRKPSGMTPQRKQIFEAAMRTLKDPSKLRELAASFEKEGLKAEAGILRKRAALFSAPPAVRQARLQVFKQAMSSTKPEAVRVVAKEFHKKGAYEAASKLRNYAKGLVGFKPTASVKIGEEEFAGDEPQSTAEV